VDKQVNGSISINDAIALQLRRLDIRGFSLLSEKVDDLLSSIRAGIIATSDSTIIDRSRVPIFDLAYHTIRKNFHPDFTDLRSLLT